MAQNQRVIPNCVYLSNPYHACTDICLQKINQTKPTKTKKSAVYRRSITDGLRGKKANEQKHAHSACSKASNPYHDCNEFCNERVSEADSGTLSLDRRKKVGSKPEPPVLDNVPASKIGAIYLSDTSSPSSNHSEEKIVEAKRSEIRQVSTEIFIQDVKPVDHKVQPNKDVAEYVAANPTGIKHEWDKHSSRKVVPITNVESTGSLTTSADGSMDLYLSNIPHDYDGDETKSVVSESRVPVGRYHVKESFASTLQSIFDKHGDIGASCRLESVVIRSYYIECVCFVVQELQSTSIVHLTDSKVKEMLAILKDVESAELNVAWLRRILDEIDDNMDFINQHRAAEFRNANSDHEMELLRKELESELETLAEKELEVSDTKTKIEEINKNLSDLKLKSSYLNKYMLYIKSQVDTLDIKSMLDELF